MKTLVLSGINLFEGGPLSIYKDCLDALLSMGIDKKFRIVAFVHKQELFKEYLGTIHFIELPKSRTTYVYRFYYEYIFFYKFSRNNEVEIWISLHDMTPNVKAKKLFTYCHNPTPFMKVDLNILKYSKIVFFMSLFYKFIYRININKNTAIIVQQNWLKREFEKRYPVKKVIVAKPDVKTDMLSKEVDVEIIKKWNRAKKGKVCFIYAAYPRPFKNFEIVCEAAKILDKKENFELFLTIDGSENAYACEIREKYKNINSINWLGIISREETFVLYQFADCLIFPSKLETWGLPISEFKLTQKPIIAAALPYAFETVGNYDKVLFFEPQNAEELAEKMRNILHRVPKFDGNNLCENENETMNNWEELLTYILT